MKLQLNLQITLSNALDAIVLKVYPPRKLKYGSICNAVCEHEGQTFMLSVFDKNIEKLQTAERLTIRILSGVFNKVHQKKDGGTMLKCSLSGAGRFEAV